MLFLNFFITTLFALCRLTAAAEELERRAALTQVTNFGENSSGAKMYIYVPNKLAQKPAIIVAIHYCTGTANAYYNGSPYAKLSETYGFIVIYPESPYSGTCWDVSSKATLTHNGKANSNSIANMVTYTLNKYSADASRVFVTGSSSGAMMTNVLAATYPEMFQAGIAYSGVPAGCFYTGTTNGWNSTCSGGQIHQSQAYWSGVVKGMYPGYTGKYPRMRVHHGSVDPTLAPSNYNETIKQWTGIFGYSETPKQTLPNNPAAPYTRYIYGDNVEGVYGAGVGHGTTIFGDADLEWFGITGNRSPTGTTTAPTASPTKATSTATAAPTTTASPGQAAPQWGQCGGKGWAGATTCSGGFTCKVVNEYYSQCQ